MGTKRSINAKTESVDGDLGNKGPAHPGQRKGTLTSTQDQDWEETAASAPSQDASRGIQVTALPHLPSTSIQKLSFPENTGTGS